MDKDSSSGEEKFSRKFVSINRRVVYNARIMISVIAGIYAGIMGATNLFGLIIYLMISILLLSLVLILKIKFDFSSFFQSKLLIFKEGLFQGLMTFVLFWTLAYNIVHIY
eukprot:TRINITY_DN3393_c0_g1_i1.p1 TRINITY_DN3393_c0_g1~~TRINITY_DN3393_c0_g1_i1.p1  ORF type:complete len:110 (+),score=1.30 TRINITY_DN3393_c0_g1_i1:44-373(+)